jgi:hypothetical protein
MPQESLMTSYGEGLQKSISTSCDACLKKALFFQFWCIPQESLFLSVMVHASRNSLSTSSDAGLNKASF